MSHLFQNQCTSPRNAKCICKNNHHHHHHHHHHYDYDYYYYYYYHFIIYFSVLIISLLVLQVYSCLWCA